MYSDTLVAIKRVADAIDELKKISGNETTTQEYKYYTSIEQKLAKIHDRLVREAHNRYMNKQNLLD